MYAVLSTVAYRLGTIVYILSIDVRSSVDSSIQVGDNCLYSIDRCTQFCPDKRNELSVKQRKPMNRLATWNMRSQLHTPRDRSLKQAFFQLDILRDKLGLSDGIVEKTAYIYRKAQSRNLTRGRTVSGILAAAIYIACREMG